jgi:hypothetical protein
VFFCLLDGEILVVLGIVNASCKIGRPILLLLENCSTTPGRRFLGQHIVL